MHFFRRVALRSATAATRQFVPKTAATTLAAQTARKTFTSNQASFVAARCFSQTAQSRTENKWNDVESKDELTPTEQAEPVEKTEPVEQAEQTEPVEDVEEAQRIQDLALKNSIYIGNLNFEVGVEHLEEAFSKFGTIVKTTHPQGARGPKGFAFIQFETPESCQKAIKEVNGQFWHGRCLVVQQAVKRERDSPRKPSETPTKTLYVGNIPYDTTDSELNTLFRELPNVKAVRIAVDKSTGWPRGFGHVEFAAAEDAELAMRKLEGVKLGYRTLVLDYAKSSPNMSKDRAEGGYKARAWRKPEDRYQ